MFQSRCNKERARRQYEQYGEREATQLQRDWKMRARKRAICPPCAPTDRAAWRAAIRAQLLKQAGDAHVLMPDALLDEVTALVEWPAVYAGRFDAAFLSLPPECLILTMQTHQKYFALRNASGALQPHFLLVSNLDTPTPEQIIAGNERVVRARLADAQ